MADGLGGSARLPDLRGGRRGRAFPEVLVVSAWRSTRCCPSKECGVRRRQPGVAPGAVR